MRLMPYMKRQQTTAVLAIIFLFVAAALNLAITFPVQWLGNNAFQTLRSGDDQYRLHGDDRHRARRSA